MTPQSLVAVRATVDYWDERMKLIKSVITLVTLALAIPLLLAACGGGQPKAPTIDVTVQNGTVTKPAVIKVKQGDTVTLNITTDEPWFFHIHGYELMKRVEPGAENAFTFDAEATGLFVIGLHKTMAAMPDVDLGPPQFAKAADNEPAGRLEVSPR